jgi:HAD superfamily hydrolase (TIGR01509 family)
VNRLRPASRDALLKAPLAPDIGVALAELQDDMGLGVAVVSNSPRLRIQPLLDKHRFDERIPKGRVFSAFEDTAGRLKENPDIYLLAAKTLGIAPEQAAAVEDSLTGMRAAAGAKIGLCVGYTGLAERAVVEELRQALLKAGAHVVIDDMKELPAAIRAHNAPRK